MANAVKKGFIPWGHVTNGKGFVPAPRKFEVASSYGTALFTGDVVQLATDGTLAIGSPTGANPAVLVGVVAYVSYVTGGKRINDTYLPASTVYSPTSRGSATASWAFVWDDPLIIYSASMAASAVANHDTQAEIFEFQGNNMDFVATAGSTTYKASGHELSGTIVEGGTANFRILGVDEEIGVDPTLANARFLVQFNESLSPVTNTTGDAS